MSFSPSRNCPGCGIKAYEGEPRKRLGPYYVHADCHVDCLLCGSEILDPPLGKAHTVVAHNGYPVHAACKEGQ